MQPIPPVVIEALLLTIAVVLIVILSYNFRDVTFKNMYYQHNKATICLIGFWLTLIGVVIGYLLAKITKGPEYLGISVGIALVGILLQIGVAMEAPPKKEERNEFTTMEKTRSVNYRPGVL